MTEVDEPMIEGVDITGLCEYLSRPNIEFALLFGSFAHGENISTSDVDIAVQFSTEMDDYERFRRRNRIDADLQTYADVFVDVSDISRLPIPVQYAALRDGILLVGDEATVDAYRETIEREYESTTRERTRNQREFIDRLARGDV